MPEHDRDDRHVPSVLPRAGSADSGMQGGDPPSEALSVLLGDLVAYFERFMVFPSEHEVVAIVLWAAHTHIFQRFDQVPYIAITSPEKGSGKTRLMELLEQVVARPWRIANSSEAPLYRKISRDKPTLLFDEVDAIFFGKMSSSERMQSLRGILNSGNRRGSGVVRMGGQNFTEIEEFEVFGPKVLAGIGELPDTVADRSIDIRLKKKSREEPVERARLRRVREAAEPLRDRLHAWSESIPPGNLEIPDDRLPDALEDRPADNWEPLLCVADMAGEAWFDRAVQAALALESAHAAHARSSVTVRLLTDLKRIWSPGEHFIASTVLCNTLNALPESPWGDWSGRGLTPRSLSGLLRVYGITSHNTGTARGYQLEALEDAWRRYVPEGTPPGDAGSPVSS